MPETIQQIPVKRERNGAEYYCLSIAAKNTSIKFENFLQKMEDFFVINSRDIRPHYCNKDISTVHMCSPENSIAFFFTNKGGKNTERIYQYGSPDPVEKRLEFEYGFFQTFCKKLIESLEK